MRQYLDYCTIFNVRNAIINIKYRKVNEIGGSENAIGIVSIDIPFRNFKLMMNVNFLVFQPNIPTLLSMKDMALNRLEISPKQAITFGTREKI